ncbi:MAG: NAD+ synthase [Nitrospirae bacterium]|nr:NAD+ synthase [Nitrospirota bacterium]
MKHVKIAFAQINTTVGDIDGNVSKICDYIKKAKESRVKIILFPELAVTGYPPEDLLLKPHFITDNIDCLTKIQAETKDITAIVGFVDRQDSNIYNAVAIFHKAQFIGVYHKIYLPNYGVFDEYRYFKPGRKASVYKSDGLSFGVNICEDVWYPEGPARSQALEGAEIIFNINASPYHMGKAYMREEMVAKRASDNNVAIAYLNAVGGQDELVFDGGSFVADRTGEIIVRAKQFKEEMIISEIVLDGYNLPIPPLTKGGEGGLEEEVYEALVLGTRDYINKNGFKQVVIGLSGGVDSSLVATIAVDAIGRENVKGVFMPSPYTSRESKEDANELAENLSIKIIEVPINRIFDAYIDTLKKEFKGLQEDITEENLQARIRGNILMAFSNKFGWLVLTTGNKSEMSVGYATLYGDMAGGFAVIKDVPKTLVYELCKWKNSKEGRALIPQRVLWKDPSAELRPDQKDTDALPPYPLLDPILKAYIEENKSFEEILSLGCDRACAEGVIRMIDNSEYKRRQSPPGIKITPRAFGKDRRFPITNRYRSY